MASTVYETEIPGGASGFAHPKELASFDTIARDMFSSSQKRNLSQEV